MNVRQGSMTYHRSFVVQVVHLNDDGYPPYWEYIAARMEGADFAALEALEKASKEVHGHNVVVEIDVTAENPEDVRWLVEDIALNALVMEWNDCNVSMHSDFMNADTAQDPTLRATTENMCAVLARKLVARAEEIMLSPAWDTITVKVWERPEINASVVLHNER